MSALKPTYIHPGRDRYLAAGGAWSHPSLDALLTERAETDSVLLVDGNRRLTGKLVNARTAALAGVMREFGVGPDDVVSWQLPNVWEAVILYRACWRLGAIAAPLHHLAGASEIAAMLDALQPSLVVAADGSGLRALSDDRDFPTAGQWSEMPDVPSVDAPWTNSQSLAAVLFTGGSSGTPKGVLHTQASLAAKARTMAREHGLTADDSVLMPAPCAHISGLLNGITLPGAVPMKSVLMAKWEPAAALRLIHDERITFMVGPPTFFRGLMASPEFAPEAVASLRLVSSGGAGVSESFCADASARLGARVKRTYGSTEAPTVATSRPDHSEVVARRYDGRAVGEVEFAIFDPDYGVPVDAGGVGELCVRGPELFAGYLNAEQTASAITADGWFRTGDLATLDSDGWLNIVGRLADVIIRGGENIATADVEGQLEAHPAISQAVVVGIPDDRLGERVGAFVVSDAEFTIDHARDWFEVRGIARFKTPEVLVRVETIPTLPSGKPDRAALREIAATRFL